MIGIDTNVLVRLHIKDDEEQFKKSKKLIESCSVQNPLYISNIMLVEWCWVLASSYKVPDKKIIKEIKYYLTAGDVLLENQEECRQALTLHQENSSDFADCLIGVLNKEQNCETTYTFDKKVAGLSGFTLLE